MRHISLIYDLIGPQLETLKNAINFNIATTFTDGYRGKKERKNCIKYSHHFCNIAFATTNVHLVQNSFFHIKFNFLIDF